MKFSGMAKAAGMIAAFTILSKVLGFVREASLAAVFGATRASDAYLMGQTIPGVVFALVGAALGTTFIPVYAQIRQERGREGAHAMADSVITATGLIALAVIAFGKAAAPWLTRLVAPGFRGEVYTLTVHLTRVLFPMVAFQGVSGLLVGMLQTEGDFLAPAAIGLLFNVLIITSTLVFGPRYGIGAVAVGTVAAALSQVLLQGPSLMRLGYRWRPRLDLREPGLRRIAALAVPVLVGTSVGQLNAVIDRMLASGLAEGSVAALNYANKLMQLVPSVLGTAIVTVMYPAFAKLSAAQEWDRYTASFAQAVKVINYVMVPVTAGMMVLSGPLVQLAFGRGAFGAGATSATSVALLFYALSVPVLSLRDLASRAFYAFQDTMAPMATGMLAVGLNIVLNLALVGPMKHGGLALATSLAALFTTALLLLALRGRLKAASGGRAGGIRGREIVGSLWRVTLAAILMAGAVWAVYGLLQGWAPGSGVIAQSVRLFGAVGAGVLVYAGLTLALGVPEAWLALETGRSVVTKSWAKAKALVAR